MKNINIKILGILFILVLFSCNRNSSDPTPTHYDGLTPSDTNTTYAQSLSMKVNGVDWVAQEYIFGGRRQSNGIAGIDFRGAKLNATGNTDTFYVHLQGSFSNDSNLIHNYDGLYNFRYNTKEYGFNWDLSFTHTYIYLNILNSVVEHYGVDSVEYIAADFYGVLHDPENYLDSIVITDGKIRFR